MGKQRAKAGAQARDRKFEEGELDAIIADVENRMEQFIRDGG